MVSESWDKLKALYAVETLQGYTEKDIELLKGIFGTLPRVLEEFYRTAGRTETIYNGEDEWVLPEHYQKREWLRHPDYMILLNEAQYVCCAGIRKEDLHLPDPPVYVMQGEENWVLCAPTTSEFLNAALTYESVYTFPYSPEEFYLLTKEEVELINTRLTKLPYEMTNWIGGVHITLFQNEKDNLAAIMDCGDGMPDMLYGAASEASYEKIQLALCGIGEPM